MPELVVADAASFLKYETAVITCLTANGIDISDNAADFEFSAHLRAGYKGAE